LNFYTGMSIDTCTCAVAFTGDEYACRHAGAA